MKYRGIMWHGVSARASNGASAYGSGSAKNGGGVMASWHQAALALSA